MAFLCKVGLHAWVGCKCSRCGKTRQMDHRWDGCKCTACGETRDAEHTWQGCKCFRCGKTRDSEHSWDRCKCTACGKTRDQDHPWSGCKCSKCGRTREEGHQWGRGLKCRECGTVGFTDSIVSTQRTAMVLRTGIKTAAVARFAKEVGISSETTAAVYMAALYHDCAPDKARAIADNYEAYQIQENSASRFQSTSQWGNAPVFIVQILARYL